MDRRSVLKQLGAIGGTSTLSKVESDIWKTADQDTLTKSDAVFSELSFAVEDDDGNFPLVAACNRFPLHTFESQRRNKVFLSRTNRNDVDVENDDMIVTHSGFESGNMDVLRFGSMPVSTTIGGSSTFISGSDTQFVKINTQGKNRFSFSFAEQDVTVRNGETVNRKTSTTIKYGTDREHSAEVNVELFAKHHGSISVVSHPHHYVFPKNNRWSRALEHSLGKENRTVSQVRTHNDAYEVIFSGRVN